MKIIKGAVIQAATIQIEVCFAPRDLRTATAWCKQIGVRRALPSHADSPCAGGKVRGKCFVGFADFG
jgi:hypothetical protein